jgi:small subunit ribosomal protein S20
MPLKQSAKKTLRIEHRRTAENDITRAKVKNALKGARIAVAKSDKDADKKISAAYRELDIAAKKNVIHKNKASRLKSRLVKKLAK